MIINHVIKISNNNSKKKKNDMSIYQIQYVTL